MAWLGEPSAAGRKESGATEMPADMDNSGTKIRIFESSARDPDCTPGHLSDVCFSTSSIAESTGQDEQAKD
jgi:hypothetical protein